MTMFHLQYPASKTFLSWDELGCLCRALGLPVDLFQRHFPTDVYELKLDEHGISVKTIQRLFELNLLQKALHRTYNFHTADWNVCVIMRALYMLEHRVLDYEGLHDVRVAYGTYEHVDMKGLVIHKHVLLRTLKMCGRSIAPLKLMHRIKHMKAEFEEKGRIQLYEFFNLIVWCDLYTVYNPQDAETAEGKEEDLFKLVDFNKLLSHHDERVAARLNEQFLAEEWDFGMEVLAGKEMFKEPPVYTEGRISQAKYHKQNYRALKKEVNHSQKRLYRAYAGSIRSRPISAPDLDNYRQHVAQKRQVESSAQEAYETVRRRLNSAPSRASSHRTDQPPQIVIGDLERPVRSQPQVVTSADLSVVKRKMEDLRFNINTLDSRCKLQVKNEMEFYIPGYLEKLANRKPEEPPIPEPERKVRHWTSKIINNLAYPASNLTPSHAKNCDARYRGWQRANSKPGWHAVITSHTHENSDKGRLYARLEQKTLEPVQYIHQDYVIRYTPNTWPGLSTASCKPAKKTCRSGQEAYQEQEQQLQQQNQVQPNFRFRSLEKQEVEDDELKENNERLIPEVKEKKALPDLSFFHNKYLLDSARTSEIEPVPAQDTKKDKHRVSSPEKEPIRQPQSFPRGLETAQRKTLEPARDKCLPVCERPALAADDSPSHDPAPLKLHVETSAPDRGDATSERPGEVSIPHMEHSKPKLVGVGQIGTIALLENIEESRDLEDSLEAYNHIEDSGEGLLYGDEDEEYVEDMSETPRPVSQAEGRQTNKVKGRPSKSQPSSNQQIREVTGALKNRPSRSAPQRRTGTASPRYSPPTVASPKRTPPRVGSPKRTPPTTSQNAGGKTGQGHKPVVTGNKVCIKNREDRGKGERSNAQVTSSSESPSSTFKAGKGFRAMRGSVTSEEEESESKQDVGSGRKRFKNQIGSTTNEDTSQQECIDDDQSIYSDALTIASSDGLSDLPASPPARIKGLPINLTLAGNSGSPATPRSAPDALTEGISAPKIQFDLVNMKGDADIGSQSSSPAVGKDILFRHSSASQRKDSLVIHYDLREYLSDSEPRRPTFSRESRARLIGRVENAISPDLKHKLMAGDPGLVA